MSPSSPADAGALLRSSAARAASRPWLLAPPLLGAAARPAIAAALAGDASAAKSSILGAVVTVVACAAFAELWLGEPGRPDAGRFRAALALYVLPILVLGAVGLAAAEFFSLAMRASPNISIPILATIIAGKLASGTTTIWVSFALALWNRERGALGALRAGAGLLAARPWLCAAFVLGTWAAQEASGLALGPLLGTTVGTPFFAAGGIAVDAFIASIALAGCVALPLQAALEAR